MPKTKRPASRRSPMPVRGRARWARLESPAAAIAPDPTTVSPATCPWRSLWRASGLAAPWARPSWAAVRSGGAAARWRHGTGRRAREPSGGAGARPRARRPNASESAAAVGSSRGARPDVGEGDRSRPPPLSLSGAPGLESAVGETSDLGGVVRRGGAPARPRRGDREPVDRSVVLGEAGGRLLSVRLRSERLHIRRRGSSPKA